MRWLHRNLCGSAALLACAVAPGGPAGAPENPAAPAEEKPAESVSKIYDVGDLTRSAPDRPTGPSVVPPTQLTGTLFHNNAAQFNNGTPKEPDRHEADTLSAANLLELLQTQVAPDTWSAQGGSASARLVENMLLVRQTPDVHRQVAAFLEALRHNRESGKAVTVHVDWLSLEPREFAQVLRPGAAGATRREIDPEAVQKLGPKVVFAHGEISCLGGQTVHLLSGRVRTVVENVDAAVGTGSAAYQPDVQRLLTGVVLQLTPHVTADTATVDVVGCVGGWDEPGKPWKVTTRVAATNPATQPSDFGFSAQAETTAGIDRVNAPGMELSTTARFPLGRAVVVGGMTAEPDAPGAGAKAGGDGGRIIYLVLRVEAE